MCPGTWCRLTAMPHFDPTSVQASISGAKSARPVIWRTVRRLAYTLLQRNGVTRRAQEGNRRYAKILAYHSVAPGESDFTRGIDVTVHPGTFANQLDYLMRYYNIVSLHELANRLKTGRPVGGYVVITFDDGFADNHEWAWPLLRQRGLPATICVSTDAIDNAEMLWVHRFNWLLNTCGPAKVLDMAGHILDRPDISSTRPKSLGILRHYMICTLSRIEREGFLASLFGALEVAPLSPADANLYLSTAQISAMSKDGVDFGCHGKTHTAFSVLSDAELTTELHDSLKRLLPLLSGDIFPALAYPFGEARHFTATSKCRVLEAGHQVILTGTGQLVAAGSSPAALSRITVVEESIPEFAARIERLSIRGNG